MITNLSYRFIARFGKQARVIPSGNEIKQQILSKRPDLEKVVNLEYKKYPYHISHLDPESPDYIASARDDYDARINVDSWNYQIDNLKRDLKMQKQVDEMVANLDRPYLRGKAGLTRNATGGLKDYMPNDIGFLQMGDPKFDLEVQHHPVFNNQKRWIAQSIFTFKQPKYSHEIQLEKDQTSRPVTDHFNPDKGCKYDVEVPYEQRYPYLADRLGHNEFVASPMERLLRLERDLYHPVFNDQPFVQSPSPNPDPTLNFEEGEVLYENTRLLEWMRMWLSAGWAGYFWCAVFAPLQLLYKTHIPTEAGLEGNFYTFYQHSIYNFDLWKLHVLGFAAANFYLSYSLVRLCYNGLGRYIIRAQYSKDKELMFITRVGPYGGTEEEVYETHHLELLPHGVTSMAQYSGSQVEDDGMYSVMSLNKKNGFYFYKQDQYWNPNLKKEFLVNHSQLFSKQHYGLKRSEQQLFDQNLIDSAYLPTSEPPRP